MQQTQGCAPNAEFNRRTKASPSYSGLRINPSAALIILLSSMTTILLSIIILSVVAGCRGGGYDTAAGSGCPSTDLNHRLTEPRIEDCVQYDIASTDGSGRCDFVEERVTLPGERVTFPGEG